FTGKDKLLVDNWGYFKTKLCKGIKISPIFKTNISSKNCCTFLQKSNEVSSDVKDAFCCQPCWYLLREEEKVIESRAKTILLKMAGTHFSPGSRLF
ncbi:hypothetical protein M5D96_009471, partial [Drosophila gunungcola]